MEFRPEELAASIIVLGNKTAWKVISLILSINNTLLLVYYTFGKLSILRNVGKMEYFIWGMIIYMERGPFIVVLFSDSNRVKT